MTKITKNFFIATFLIAALASGCSKKSSGGGTSQLNDPGATEQNTKTETDYIPELTPEQEDVKQKLEEMFGGGGSGDDSGDGNTTDDSEIEDIVEDNTEMIDELSSMGFDSTTIANLMGDHFDLGDTSAFTDLLSNDGSSMTTDQITELLQEQYPDLNIGEAFSLPDTGDDSIVSQLMDAGGDQSSLIDILMGRFTGG